MSLTRANALGWQVASLIGPSLTRLQDAEMSQLFYKVAGIQRGGAAQKQEGSATALQGILRL